MTCPELVKEGSNHSVSVAFLVRASVVVERETLGFLRQCLHSCAWVSGTKRFDSCEHQQSAKLLKRRNTRFASFLYEGCDGKNRRQAGGS